MKRVLFLLLLQYLSKFFTCLAQVNSVFPEVPIISLSGDTISSTSVLEGGRRSFVCFFATWCPPSVREFDYLYEKGVVDLCKKNNVKTILITDKNPPFIFKGLQPKGNWPDKISEDFTICVDRSLTFLQSVKGEKSFPFGCIVETDSLISYCYSGFSEERIDSLIKRLCPPQLKICKNCKGIGENPNYCRSCNGKGIGYKFIPEMCRACAGGNPRCPICRGTGRYGTRRVKVPCSACDGIPSLACPSCNGKGKMYIQQQDSTYIKAGTCQLCQGKGKIQVQCSACGGTGRSAHITEYRMKHDIDYWVCRPCQGYGKRYDKCPECKAFNNDVTVIISK